MTNAIQFLDSVKSMPLMNLPVRSTVLQLSKATILISPGSALENKDFQGLTPFTDIVAPSLFHDGGIRKAFKILPTVRFWAAPGLSQKKRDIPWTAEITPTTWPYDNELKAILIEGMPKINEVVFVHLASKSLIVSDLVFNMHTMQSWTAKAILKCFGTYERFAMSRFFARFIQDRSAFKRSLQHVFTYDFDRIIVGHGDNILHDGKNRLRAALQERVGPF